MDFFPLQRQYNNFRAKHTIRGSFSLNSTVMAMAATKDFEIKLGNQEYSFDI